MTKEKTVIIIAIAIAISILAIIGIMLLPALAQSIAVPGDTFYGNVGDNAHFKIEWRNAIVDATHPLSFLGGLDIQISPGYTPTIVVQVDGKNVKRINVGQYCHDSVPNCPSWDQGKTLVALSLSDLKRELRTVMVDGQPVLQEFPNPDFKSGKHLVKLFFSPESMYFITQAEIWADDELCSLSEGYFWAIEQFREGQTVSTIGGPGETKLRFRASTFCSQRPILVTQMGQVVEQRVEDFDLLKNSYVTIPSGQIWEISYIVNENDAPDIMIDCGDPDAAYDADRDVCIKMPTIVYDCKGTWDATNMVCVVQTETRCEDPNATYDSATQKCYLFVSDEVAICPEGSSLVVSSEGIRQCVFDPEYLCEGYLDYGFNPPKCYVLPETETIQLPNANWLWGFALIAVILVIGIIIIVIKQGVKK